MKAFRLLLGWVLVFHGLAHASAGMWATDIGGRAIVTVLWELTTIGFIAAAAGLFGVARLRKWWRQLTIVGAISSLLLLILYSHPLFRVGIAVDVLLVVIAFAPYLGRELSALPPVSSLARIIVILLMIQSGVAIGLRPWHSSWGTTRSEQQMVLIGDPPIGESHYRIDHAITIHAPVDSVWPWLIQIGQDRAGFYSYERLERLFGVAIFNSDRVVPEWQSRQVGDRVRATQPGYLGGLFGAEPGWKIAQLEPGHALVLEKWGAFVLEPMGPTTTRFHIRTRGDGVPTLAGIAITPLSLMILEPAHFVMERGMMLGLKRRAERSGAAPAVGESPTPRS